jgi:hypothetical protein
MDLKIYTTDCDLICDKGSKNINPVVFSLPYKNSNHKKLPNCHQANEV